MQSIPFFNTYIDPSAFSIIKKTLETTFISEGKIVAEFESKLENFGLSHPFAVNSGTSALHLALLLAGVKKGDEVIIPAQTFVATALAVLYVGAKPVFADIEYETGNISVQSIEKKITKKTKAIIPVHWAGYPVDLKSISKLASAHKLVVIEDAAHALGATYKGKKIGSISPFTCFSFQAIKHLTTGDGGAVACKTASLEKRGKSLRWFGIDRDHAAPTLLGEREYVLEEIGYKYHLNDYAASLGIANFSTLQKRLNRRKKIAKQYSKSFEKMNGITPFTYESGRESSWWIYGVHVEKRDNFINALRDRGVSTSVVHQRIDKHPIFGGLNKNLENQREFDKTQIHLPVYDQLSDAQVEHIIKSVQKGW